MFTVKFIYKLQSKTASGCQCSFWELLYPRTLASMCAFDVSIDRKPLLSIYCPLKKRNGSNNETNSCPRSVLDDGSPRTAASVPVVLPIPQAEVWEGG